MPVNLPTFETRATAEMQQASSPTKQQMYVPIAPPDDEQEQGVSHSDFDKQKAGSGPAASKGNVPALWLWVCVLNLAVTVALVYWAGPWGKGHSAEPTSMAEFGLQRHQTGLDVSQGYTTGLVRSEAISSDPSMRYFPQAGLCSNQHWMAGYSELHHNIRSGSQPPRYLISRAVQKGLADRLTGVITQLYLAMLSGRALTLVTIDQTPDLAAVCDMPNINWTHPNPIPDDALRVTKQEVRRGDVPKSVDRSRYYLINTQDDYVLDRLVQRENFTAFPRSHPDVENVLWVSNRGATYPLMSNPYHRSQLWQYGLTSENAFMCGFFYLCKPNSALTALYEPYWKVMSDPDTLKIGIQVRVGDWVFTRNRPQNDSTWLARAQDHLDCAGQIEKVYAAPGQKVVWYFMSDSIDLSKAVQRRYGSKVLTETKYKPEHVDCKVYKRKPEACNTSMVNQALQHALGQMLTFSKADYHVYSTNSGFGRAGAWISGKHDNLFGVGGLTKCNPKKPATPSESAHQWSRILK